VSRGKVRDIYATDGSLVLVATDRISAFDCVLSPGIPGRGVVLTRLSTFWFRRFADRVPNHLLATELADFPAPYRDHPELAGRSVLVRRLRADPGGVRGPRLPRRLGLAGVPGGRHGLRRRLPAGLSESAELPEPIFTPATKATDGHDENISFDRTVEIVGEETAAKLRDLTLGLYGAAAAYARERGIIIADTKFEFGFDDDGRIVWMDEALTPDSSRFWPADGYRPGRHRPPSTSSTCATGWSRAAGTRSRRRRPCRRRWSRARWRATSRPTAC
jgi:phosphoribosylaminoimidazole-succinocarboxamide synthase